MRRWFLLGLLLLPGLAAAQEFPDRPIRLIVAFGPGGGADTTARLLAGPLGQALGQPVLVENRAGGGGTAGGQAVAQARPDGYTLLVDASAFAVRHKLFARLAFDYERDFEPLARLTVMPLLLVVPPDDPAADVAGLVAALKARPRPPLYSVAGTGSASHFAALLLAERGGFAAEAVAYRGGAQGALAVVQGEGAFNFATTPSAIGLVNGGRLKALGVSSASRMQALPAVPTVAEAGLPGFTLTEWIALYAPAHTPAPILARLSAALKGALAQPEVVAKLADVGAEPALLEGEAFANYLAGQRRLLSGLADAAGLKPE